MLAIRGWSRYLHGRRLFLFVDNEAANYSLISGVSRNLASAELIDTYWNFAVSCEVSAWVERVPSKSIPADDPSWLEVAALLARGVQRIYIQREWYS